MKIRYKVSQKAINEGVVNNVKNWVYKKLGTKQSKEQGAFSGITDYLSKILTKSPEQFKREIMDVIKHDFKDKPEQIVAYEKALDRILLQTNVKEEDLMSLPENIRQAVKKYLSKNKGKKIASATQSSAQATSTPPTPPLSVYEKPLVKTTDLENHKEITSFYSKKLPTINPENITKILGALIQNNRMLAESKIKEQTGERGRGLKLTIGGEYQKPSSEKMGVPMQKAKIDDFDTLKQTSKFKNLLSLIVKQTSAPEQEVEQVLNLVFNNGKLSYGGEAEEYLDIDRERLIGSNIDEKKSLSRMKDLAGIKK
jgi:hypothetical protein